MKSDHHFYVLCASVFGASCLAVGGLAAVIYTDTLQMFVMVTGALVLTIVSQYLSLLFSYRTLHNAGDGLTYKFISVHISGFVSCRCFAASDGPIPIFFFCPSLPFLPE